MWHFIPLFKEKRHAIYKASLPKTLCFSGTLTQSAWAFICMEIREDFPSSPVDFNTPYICQLLGLQEAQLIHETTDPSSVPFINDIARPVIRVTSGILTDAVDDDHPYSPLKQQEHSYFYWKVVSFVTLRMMVSSGEEVRNIPLAMISGTSFKYFCSIDVRLGSSYGEFAGLLKHLLESVDRAPWVSIASSINMRHPLIISDLRFYLYPVNMEVDDFGILSAIHAGPHSSISQVPREIAWSDWFAAVPLHDMMPSDNRYGLLMVPGRVLPWRESFIGPVYKQRLEAQSVQLGDPHMPNNILLDEIPGYLASDYAGVMKKYERDASDQGGFDVAQWASERGDAVLEREETRIPFCVDGLVPGDSLLIRNSAHLVTEIAEGLCSALNKW
jgi:hypothetical protein